MTPASLMTQRDEDRSSTRERGGELSAVCTFERGERVSVHGGAVLGSLAYLTAGGCVQHTADSPTLVLDLRPRTQKLAVGLPCSHGSRCRHE